MFEIEETSKMMVSKIDSYLESIAKDIRYAGMRDSSDRWGVQAISLFSSSDNPCFL